MTAPKLRVLFHVTHFKRGGGIENSLLSWLSVLDRERFSVALSIAYPTRDLDEVFRSRIPEDVEVTLLAPEAWLSHCRNLKMERRLGVAGRLYEELLLPQFRKRIFRKRIGKLAKECDVIVDYDMSLARFAHDLGRPLIGISHFSLAQRLERNRRKYRTAARYFRRYDAIVSICDAMRAEGARLFPEIAGRFVTLYPGFDLEHITSRANEAVGDIPACPYIVSVTRLEETQKDVGTLIKAYALLVREHGIEAPLLIVGEGRHRADLERLAAEQGVQERVIFAGFKFNPLPYVRNARMMVLSSKFEGLPTVLIEGLALGQLLVATDCPTGPREILDDGRAGLLVPVGDVAALAQAMRQGLNDAACRETLQGGAARHAPTFGKEAWRTRFSALAANLPGISDGVSGGCVDPAPDARAMRAPR